MQRRAFWNKEQQKHLNTTYLVLIVNLSITTLMKIMYFALWHLVRTILWGVLCELKKQTVERLTGIVPL